MSTWSRTLQDHKTRQRDLILDAAGAIVSEDGISGLSMSSLASRAGITRPTLYNYFNDIDAAIEAYGRREIEREWESLHKELHSETDPLRRLEILIARMIEGNADHDHAHDVDWTKWIPSTEELKNDVTELAAEVIRDGARQDLFRSDVDADDTAALLVGMIESAHMRTHKGADATGLSQTTVDFAKRILAPA